jgi:hypothetical protein
MFQIQMRLTLQARGSQSKQSLYTKTIMGLMAAVIHFICHLQISIHRNNQFSCLLTIKTMFKQLSCVT